VITKKPKKKGEKKKEKVKKNEKVKKKKNALWIINEFIVGEQ
jgi:hypothetical protein